METSTSSIIIFPSSPSMIQHKAFAIELFPAPVQPTTPIFYPGSISKLTSLNTKSVSYLYHTEKF